MERESLISRRAVQTVSWLLLSYLATWPLSHFAFAQVPHLIRYQGQAVDSKGVPLEGPYTLTFRLYDAETGGTKLWEETQANVPITKGHFSILLGQVTPLTTMSWGEPCWLSAQVGTEPELSPRQRITSVPLAMRAEKAEGLINPVTTSTITDDANKLVPSGAVILWTGASCPSGYTRFTALDGKFLVADATYNAAAGGSNTKDISHQHSAGSYTAADHTHGAGSYLITNTNTHGGGCCGGGVNNGTTPVTGTSGSSGPLAVSGTSGTGGSASLDIRPAFATLLLCQKD